MPAKTKKRGNNEKRLASYLALGIQKTNIATFNV